MAISKQQQSIIDHYAATHRIGGVKPDLRPWYRRHKRRLPEDREAERLYMLRPVGWSAWDLAAVVKALQRMLRRGRRRDRVARHRLVTELRRERVSSWWGRVIDTACEIGLLMTDSEGNVMEAPVHEDETAPHA